MPEYLKLLTLLPLDRAASALLGPATAVREATVGLARAARTWELTLANVAGRELDEGHGPPLPTPAAQRITDRVGGPPDAPQPKHEVDPAEPPVVGWAEMSPADARSAVSDLPASDLRALLAYERQHGHRPQYVLLLESRIKDARSA